MTLTFSIRSVVARWLPVCALLILTTAACKKYRGDRIRLSGYRETRADMGTTDTFSVFYQIIDQADEPADFEEVIIQSKEATITGDFVRVDSVDGETYVRINYYTRITPSGSYPVKAIVKNKSGAFAEVVTTINVVNYLELLRGVTSFGNVGDSLDSYPYTDPVYQVQYSTTATPLPGGPTNAFRFSRLGIYPSFGNTSLITNVTVYVDSLTGRITAPLQQTGNATSYKGTGQFTRRDGVISLRGTFAYDFYTPFGDHYEGRLSF